MQFVQMTGALLVGLAVHAPVAAQPGSYSVIVDPPRQEIQTISPNLLVGSYLVNVMGTTYAYDVFVDAEVSDHGQPIADGSTVTFDAVPATSRDADAASGRLVHLVASTSGGHAKFLSQALDNGDWLMTWSVVGPAGAGSSSPQKVGIDPRHPSESMTSKVATAASPLVVVILLLAFFSARHVALVQRPSVRAPAQPKVVGNGVCHMVRQQDYRGRYQHASWGDVDPSGQN
jgi:hypothetical protein